MLKHPFSKLMCVHKDGSAAYMLMMGHYTADNICAIPESFGRYARSMGLHVEDDCLVYIFYLGPDAIPLEQTIFLPNCMPAKVIPVANGQNAIRLIPIARQYIRLMEDVQTALQMGMSRDNAAFHYWKLHCAQCYEYEEESICFVHCFEEFRRDVYDIRAMLKEQDMLPKNRSRKRIPQDRLSNNIPNPYEELGLDPHNFGV